MLATGISSSSVATVPNLVILLVCTRFGGRGIHTLCKDRNVLSEIVLAPSVSISSIGSTIGFRQRIVSNKHQKHWIESYPCMYSYHENLLVIRCMLFADGWLPLLRVLPDLSVKEVIKDSSRSGSAPYLESRQT